jgi:hypothetical protein
VGDLGLEVNGTPVADIDQAVRAIRSGPPRQKLASCARQAADHRGADRAADQPEPATSPGRRAGAVVYAVGAPADDELRPGDVLLDYATTGDFVSALKAHGDDLRVRVRREGTPRQVSVKLEPIPDSRYRLATRSSIASRGAARPRLAHLAGVEPPRGCSRDIECQGDRICVKGGAPTRWGVARGPALCGAPTTPSAEAG